MFLSSDSLARRSVLQSLTEVKSERKRDEKLKKKKKKKDSNWSVLSSFLYFFFYYNNNKKQAKTFSFEGQGRKKSAIFRKNDVQIPENFPRKKGTRPIRDLNP